MRRAWRLPARRWRRRSSTPWSFSASSAWSAACATRWPVSRNPRANLLRKNYEFPLRAETYFWHSAWRLLLSKNFRVGGPCCGGRSDDVQRRVESECDRGQAKLGAAGLVTELQRNVLLAERSACERRHRHAENHGVLVDVQRNLGEGEFFELAFG